MAKEEDVTPAALLVRLVADFFEPEDLTAVAEIGAALSDLEAAEARGDYGRPIGEFWAEMDAEFDAKGAKDTLRS